MSAKSKKYLPLLAVPVLAVLVWVVAPRRAATNEDAALLCHVGGTMTPVFEELARAYGLRSGKTVDITSAGSGELLATIDMRREGDLYASHDPFMDVLMKRDLGVDGWCLSELVPVMVVPEGNPKGLTGMKDLMREDVSVCLTDYTHSTLGHMLPFLFDKAGIGFAEFNARKKVTTHRSGSHVANLVGMKSFDAGIVWQAVAHLRREVVDVVRIDDVLPVPDVDAVTSATGKRYILAPVKVTLCTLSCSSNIDAAREFVEFVLSAEGGRILTDYGFQLPAGGARKAYENGQKMGRK
ncbi:MAG: substrate-binding domain-containing protein [Lentisphaeria bacterium]|nr:substrate-binding domain-containing protein [Lentisphaeria bacterium]